MDYYEDSDLAFTDDGDFELDETGDFKMVQGMECTADDINMAVKTQKNDSEVYPDFGADLEELVGQPNIRQVGEEGTKRIVSELVQDGIVNPTDLTVVPVPIEDSISYYIVVETDGEKTVVENTLNLSDSFGSGGGNS